MTKFLSYYFNNTCIIHVNIHTNLHIYMFKQTAGCREEVGWGHWLSPPRSFCLKILGNLACLHNKLFGNRIIKFAPNMHLGILSARRKWVSLTSAFKIISTGNSRNTFNVAQGWGQIRFIKYKYKYKYKNLDFSNTNTNTNILLKFDSNTNTNTSIQIQTRSTKYICWKLFGS